MSKALLSDRSILAIEGASKKEVVDFLQPLITQNVENVSENQLHYGLHLTAQGRLIADMFLFWHPKKIHTLCLDVHQEMLMPLAKRFHGYILGQKVELHDLSDDFTILGIWNEEADLYLDPRLPELGGRAYLTEKEVSADASLEDYHVHRLSLGVPDVFYDCPAQKALPAQYNMQHLSAIDFNKGCYVGQEVTARLHFRSTKATKILYQAEAQHGSCQQSILHPKSGSEVGMLGHTFGGRALASIQARLTPDLFSDFTLTLPAYLPRDSVGE